MVKFKKGSLVYVAHPYSGRPCNKRQVGILLHKLYDKYKGVTFVSPLHTIVCSYFDTDYKDGLKLCTNLLKRCDVLLLTGKWYASVGCNKELAYAKRHKMLIVALDEKGALYERP